MKRLLVLASLVVAALSGCVVLPVEGPFHDHHHREYRGYGYYGGHAREPYYQRDNAGYHR